jgi:hypothetical protein
MSLDIDKLATAYTLCTCNGACVRSCTVCQSPTWKGQRACVRILYDEITAPLTDEQIVERAIEFMESLGMALEPWQAVVLRQTMLCEHVMVASVRQPVPRGYKRVVDL